MNQRFALVEIMVFVLLIAALCSGNAQAMTWDLATDFQRYNENGDGTPFEAQGLGPDGVWSYHAVVGGEARVFDMGQTTVFSGDDGMPPDNQWSISGLPSDPWIAIVEPGAENPSGNDLEEGEINIQSGALGDQNILIRWTAPADMVVNMTGEYWGAHRGQAARGGDFQVDHTDGFGVILANLVAPTAYTGAEFNESLFPGDVGYVHKEFGHTFSASNISVAAGETIELLSIADGACCGSIDGVEFTIDDGDGTVVTPTPGDLEWRLDGVGEWSQISNWQPRKIPNGNDVTVRFLDTITADRTVVTTEDVTVKRIEFDNANRYIIAGAGSVNLAAPTGEFANITVISGDHEFQAVTNIQGNADVVVAGGSTLTFNNALNFNGNTVIKTGDGTLAVNNVIAFGGGNLTVLNGLLTGNGTLGGDLNNAAGILSPGNSGGNVTVVPEPSTAVMVLLGFLCAGMLVRRGS